MALVMVPSVDDGVQGTVPYPKPLDIFLLDRQSQIECCVRIGEDLTMSLADAPQIGLINFQDVDI